MDESANPVNDTPEGWGEDESRVFVEFGRAMVPGREEIERTFLALLPVASDEPFVGVEIGTGTGWLCAAVLRTFPGARMVGLDGSKEMLRVAGDVLVAYQDRAELRPFRLEEDSWVEGLPPVRVFLSSLVLHHLDGPGKRGLFARAVRAAVRSPRTRRRATVRRRDGAAHGSRPETLRRLLDRGGPPPLAGHPRRRAGLRVLRTRALEHV
jgi:tRNA (cmo5U34)-methyltransferase